MVLKGFHSVFIDFQGASCVLVFVQVFFHGSKGLSWFFRVLHVFFEGLYGFEGFQRASTSFSGVSQFLDVVHGL